MRRTIEVTKHFVEHKNKYGDTEQPVMINMHIHDGKENPPKNHLPLGDGEIDLIEALKNL